MKMDIGYSSLTERVFMGKSKTAKGMKKGVKQFVGDKIDITNKFLFIVEQYFKVGTSRVIEQGEKSTMYISIENTKEAKEKLIESLKKDLTTL